MFLAVMLESALSLPGLARADEPDSSTPVIPLTVYSETIDLAVLTGVGTPRALTLAENVEQMLGLIFRVTEGAPHRLIAIAATYVYPIATAADDAGKEGALDVAAPMFYAPAQAFAAVEDWAPMVGCDAGPSDTSFTCRIAGLLHEWIEGTDPPKRGARLVFQVSVYAFDPSVVILQYEKLSLKLGYITDFPD